MEMATTATTKTNGHILKERAPLCLKGRQDVPFVDQKTVIILYIVISYKHIWRSSCFNRLYNL